MTDSQGWIISDNSTFVGEDNCVYQLVNVGDDQQFSDYSTLQNFLNGNEVVLTDPSSAHVFDQNTFLDGNVILDQNCERNSNLKPSDDIVNSNEKDDRGSAVSNDYGSSAGQASTVMYVDDLKEELERGSDCKKEFEKVIEDEIDTDVNIKLPNNPKEMLDTLTPMLEINGGLKKNNQESFLKIMKSCDLMPLQCLLINIIRSSQNIVLKKLLMQGGFNELHSWLKEARTHINKPLMLELLQLFKQLPVTTKLLRTNSCAKDIKQLIKHKDERISRFARVIVDNWMKVVSESSKTKEKPKDEEKKSEKKSSKENISPVKQSKNPEKKDKTEVPNESPKTETLVNNDIENKTVKNERPKTVKRRQYTFRMTGLEEDATFKSTTKKSEAPTPTTIKASSGSASDKNDADNKSSFFDALQFNSSFLHRKRKSSTTTAKSTNTSTTTTTSPTTTTTKITSPTVTDNTDDDISSVLPNFSYYKPVEETDASKTPPDAVSSSSPIHHDSKEPETKKLKKSVSWASDDTLCHFRFFDVDPTERCNVNTNNYFQRDDNETFVDHRRHEFQMEREMLQEWHKAQHPQPVSAKIEWSTPRVIEFEPPNDVVPGCESKEKDIQKEREAKVLQYIYFDKSSIVDYPSEPDPETPMEEVECKLIPLNPVEEDEEGMENDQGGQEEDSSATPRPTVLLPILSDMINNVMNKNVSTNATLVNNNENINSFPNPNNDFSSNNFQNQTSHVNNAQNNEPTFYSTENYNNVPSNNYNFDNKKNFNNTNQPFYGAYNGSFSNSNGNNYNDAKPSEPAFTTMPFNQSNPVYPIGFNQPTFESSGQRLPFEGGRGFARGRPGDFHNFRPNGNFPPKKFNRNKNIDSNEVCRYFLQGKCLFGSNCKKIHPSK